MAGFATPKAQQEPPEEQEVDEAMEADIGTASGMLGSLILQPEGQQAVVKALQSSNPPKMVAMFLAQGIEMIQRRSMETETPLDPRIWLADGGVVDEIMPDLAEVADGNGVPIRIGDMLPPLKQELTKVIQTRGQQLQQEHQGQGQQQPAGPPNLAAPGG